MTMKIKHIFYAFAFGAIALTACNSGETKDPNETKTDSSVVDPNIIQNTPAYTPSKEETEQAIKIKGSCALFYYPSAEEMKSIPDAASDKEEFLKQANLAKEKYEAKGVKVYISDKPNISIHVSDTRSVEFNHSERTAKFGIVFYKEDNAPYYVDGVRTGTDIERLLERYFFNAQN